MLRDAAEVADGRLPLLLSMRSEVSRGERREREPAGAAYPPFFALASSISLSSFGGDIGSDCGRTPMHWPIALAIAAIVGTTGTSPTPRSPYGCRGFGTSTISVPIIGTSDATGMR